MQWGVYCTCLIAPANVSAFLLREPDLALTFEFRADSRAVLDLG